MRLFDLEALDGIFSTKLCLPAEQYFESPIAWQNGYWANGVDPVSKAVDYIGLHT